MKKLEDLKPGDEFYKVTHNTIKKYEYLMIYPFRNPANRKINSYHILIDKSIEEPVRMYYTEIERILEQECYTYEHAKILQISILEKQLNDLKEFYKIS